MVLACAGGRGIFRGMVVNIARQSVQPSAPEIPRLLVEKFDDLTGTEASAAIASGLTQEVVAQLSKFKDIVVVQSIGTVTGKETVPRGFVLSGSVNLSADAFRLQVQLHQLGPTARSCGQTATTAE